MLFVYRTIVALTCVAVVVILLGSFGLKAAEVEYTLAKDTRTTWNRVIHPFTSDTEYVFQNGGGLGRLNRMFPIGELR